MKELSTSAGELHEDLVSNPREQVLRKLLPLPGDYEYALNSGLIDLFYFDPSTGYDGLLHTLSGQYEVGEDGSVIPRGFHHEPSATASWPMQMSPNGKEVIVTRVDRESLDGLSSSKRRRYEEWPFEPYVGHVVIDGLVEYGDKPSASRLPDRLNKSFFPKEYVALTVMQAVRIAYNSRNRENDYSSVAENGHPVVVSHGEAPLVNGKAHMQVRLILDEESRKVVTAMPLVPRRPGVMKLTKEGIATHVFGLSTEEAKKFASRKDVDWERLGIVP